MEWYEILISVLTGLAAVIPLGIQLAQWIQKAVREKNWQKVLELVMNLVQEAEGKFNNGEERKSWVMMAVKASADTIDYEINMDDVSKLIDSLCTLSKKVNAPKTEDKIEE